MLDGDILTYEIGFASDVGWQGEGVPPFAYAEELLLNRINNILAITGSDSYQIYLTGKGNFREAISKTRVYKGNRKEAKPFHYKNLRAYMVGMLNGIIVDGMEADDAMAIEQDKHCIRLEENPFYMGGVPQTIICTRDKDLRMVPGFHYGWELGNQPSFGPKYISEIEGHRSFFMQCLTGDTVDNIQGLPKCGPVKALKILEGTTTYLEMFEAVREAYRAFYEDFEKADEQLLEMGQLLWMVRELDEEDNPVMWRFPNT